MGQQFYACTMLCVLCGQYRVMCIMLMVGGLLYAVLYSVVSGWSLDDGGLSQVITTTNNKNVHNTILYIFAFSLITKDQGKQQNTDIRKTLLWFQSVVCGRWWSVSCVLYWVENGWWLLFDIRFVVDGYYNQQQERT